MKIVLSFALGGLLVFMLAANLTDCQHRREVYDDLVRKGCRPVKVIVDGHSECCRPTCVTPDGQIYQTVLN